MANISFSGGNLIEGDFREPFNPPNKPLPNSYKVAGRCPTLLNFLLVLPVIVAFFGQGAMTAYFMDLGYTEEDSRRTAFASIFLVFFGQIAAASIVRFVNTRSVELSKHGVTVGFPHNPLKAPQQTPLTSFLGVSRHLGRRYRRRRKIVQEIIELEHPNPSLSVPLRVNENYSSSQDELKKLASNLGVLLLGDNL